MTEIAGFAQVQPHTQKSVKVGKSPPQEKEKLRNFVFPNNKEGRLQLIWVENGKKWHKKTLFETKLGSECFSNQE